jgi:phenylalanine-4-hydroxylase
LLHKKLSGQTPSFTQWVKTTNQAEAILTKFWQERLPLERELLGKDPVKITNWEEWFPNNHEFKSNISVFNKAIETEAPVRLRTDNSGVDGVLSKVIYSAQGEPIYVQFKGPAQLIDRVDRVITGQGPESHGEGYSAPVGRIKSITINGRQRSNLGELRSNQKVEIYYESGVVVRGDLKDVTLDESNSPTVLTFTTAEVRLNEKVLYNPAWGKFDLILADQVQSVEFF